MAHSGPKPPHSDTLAVHAGQSPDPATGARAVPIYQTASFVFPDTDTAAALFNMETPGHVYSRLSNPTVAVFEERMAALEDGVGAIATSSGQAALHLAIATLMGEGGHVVASASLYGGSHNLLAYTLAALRDPRPRSCPRATWTRGARAITPATRLLFGESVGNPSVDVLDVPALARARRRAPHSVARGRDGHHARARASLRAGSASRHPLGHQVPLRPRRGHRRRAGGWRALRLGGRRGSFPTLTEPYEGFHGMVFAEESSDLGVPAARAARRACATSGRAWRR